MPIPSDIIRISDTVWEIPVSHKAGMLVPARIFATEALLSEFDDGVFEQITNVATLTGIVGHACCMPDGHWGYGFPIGGLAAMDPDHGVISPGGIGFDINCGMRLCLTNLTYGEVQPRLRNLVDRIAGRVPAGVGVQGTVRLSRDEFRQAVEQGSRWAVKSGFGWKEDLERTEEGGCLAGADASRVSEKAVDRGYRQIGTLGSGNHYLEIQVAKAENVFDQDTARDFGIVLPDQVVVMFHCGSRGFGHQVATDYLRIFVAAMHGKYRIHVPDRELACAPFRSPEGQDYFAAMKCAVNMSFANRQVILHRIREVFSEVFGKGPEGPRDAPGLRRLAQHGQARAARLRGEAAGTARPPEGSDPGVRSRDAGAPRCLPEDRPAGDPRREHGDRIVPAGGSRHRRFHVLHDRARQRAGDEPDRGQKAIPRAPAPGADGGTGDLRADGELVRPRRGGGPRLQERRRRGLGHGARGAQPAGRPPAPGGKREGMTAPYRYLEEIATADVAFEAWGATREETFLAAADATLNTMVEEIGTVAPRERRVFSLAADSLDLLLFELLQELVYHKDADRLLLRVRDLRIEETGSGFRLHAEAIGETIDPGRHPLLADVKAVTLHRLSVEKTPSGWRAVVVLDV